MKGDKRRQFVWSLLRFLLCLPIRFILGFKAKVYKLDKNKPYVVLINHVAQIDPIYVAMSFRRHINFVCFAGVCYGKYGKILNRYFAPIPKTKGKTDMMCIRESLKVMKKNGVLGLFPSGDCTFSGVESYIDPSVVKFLRMMKAEVLLYRTEGVYGKSPRWARKRTKGKMYGSVKRVITVDEMNKMTDEELYNAVVETIGGNGLDYIGENQYKGRYCAEYLERTLYVCPDCGEISTMISHRDLFTCAKCGYKAVYKPNLHFELVKGKNHYETVNDWYNYCIEPGESCIKRFSDRGSIPLTSTKRKRPRSAWSFLRLVSVRESNGSVVNDCQWQSEPTLTEPAGESDSQTSRRLDARGMFFIHPHGCPFVFGRGSGLKRISHQKSQRDFCVKVLIPRPHRLNLTCGLFCVWYR